MNKKFMNYNFLRIYIFITLARDEKNRKAKKSFTKRPKIFYFLNLSLTYKQILKLSFRKH